MLGAGAGRGVVAACTLRCVGLTGVRAAARRGRDDASSLPADAMLRPRTLRESRTAGAAATHVLDLRGLPAPEPLVRALEAAAALGPGERLDLLTPVMPYPLLQALAAQGFDVAAERRDDGSAGVTVRRPPDTVDGPSRA